MNHSFTHAQSIPLKLLLFALQTYIFIWLKKNKIKKKKAREEATLWTNAGGDLSVWLQNHQDGSYLVLSSPEGDTIHQHLFPGSLSSWWLSTLYWHWQCWFRKLFLFFNLLFLGLTIWFTSTVFACGSSFHSALCFPSVFPLTAFFRTPTFIVCGTQQWALHTLTRDNEGGRNSGSILETAFLFPHLCVVVYDAGACVQSLP